MIFERLRRRLEWDGTRGLPRSSNQASSLHLTWVVPEGDWIEVEAVLEVLAAPQVRALSFWALQVGFVDRRHQKKIAGQFGTRFALSPEHPGMVAGVERVGEIATGPGMRVDALLERDHLVQVRQRHRRIVETIETI